MLKCSDEYSSQSVTTTLQIGSVHLTDKKLEKKVNIIGDMSGC